MRLEKPPQPYVVAAPTLKVSDILSPPTDSSYQQPVPLRAKWFELPASLMIESIRVCVSWACMGRALTASA